MCNSFILKFNLNQVHSFLILLQSTLLYSFQALAALGPYIRDFQGSFTVQNVAGALQGLQKMKSGALLCRVV